MKYTYPSPRVVSQANSLVVVKFEIDFVKEKFVLAFREINKDGQVVSSPTVVFDDLDKPDLFANTAGGLSGSTFEEKLLAPAVLRQLLPWVPAGGTVEDL